MSSAEPAAAGGGAPAGGEEPVASAAHHTNSDGGGVTTAVRHPRVALVTGITGQDGSYLAELLLQKGYIVWGIIRRASNFNTARIEHIRHKLVLRYGDLSDAVGLQNILRNIKALDPERLEVYNLAAMSHVKVSFELPVYAGTVDGIGTLLMLEAIRITGLEHVCRFYQASTSEMFGKVHETPQRETTPFHPRSPYGVAKLYAYWITRNYREAYGMFACSGILFNHESERRGATFVTRKITIGLGKILSGEENELVLGNLEALRDWGHAEDYVRGMWMMLQQDQPDDFVLATNETHSVREFVEKVFRMRGIALRWEGKGLGERGVDQESGRTLVRVSEQYFRPAEVDLLLGDASKARERMGWRPLVSFDELVCRMVMKDVPPHLTRQGVLHTADHTVVLVTGGTGLVGCGVRAVLDGAAIGGPRGAGDSGYADWYRRRTDEVWIFASSKDADLTDMESTRKLFAKHRPTHCLHLAARVGGLFRNMRQPLDFFVDNMHMNMNVLKACDEFGVTRCVSCLSTCIFPDKVEYPITEAALHDGAPHTSNAAYAHAKRMVDVLSRSYATQKPHRCFTTVVPTNVYGPSDNYHLEDAHVIPALIHKCHLAKQAGDAQFVVMGSGRPLRQFVHSHDLGRLMVWAVREYDDVAEPVIFSPAPAAEVSIGDVARAIKDAIGFEGDLVFDATKADGQLRKTADNAKLRRLLHAGPRGSGGSGDDAGGAATKSPPNPLEFDFVTIRDGVRNAVDWLVANFETARK